MACFQSRHFNQTPFVGSDCSYPVSGALYAAPLWSGAHLFSCGWRYYVKPFSVDRINGKEYIFLENDRPSLMLISNVAWKWSETGSICFLTFPHVVYEQMLIPGKGENCFGSTLRHNNTRNQIPKETKRSFVGQEIEAIGEKPDNRL